MNNVNEHPYIQFNFKNAPLAFKNPIETIVAPNVSEVIPRLNDIQQAIANGYYIAGYISYEASSVFNPNLVVKKPSHMPLMWFGVFKEPTSHTKQENGSFHVENWNLNITKNEFSKAFQHIQQAIKDKKINQINYTTHYETQFNGDSYSYYNQLVNAQMANYSAYINTGNFEILSASPELFFEINENTIKTKPMKGTIGRGLTYEEDVTNKTWLEQSEKNKIENELTTQLMCEELKEIVHDHSIHIYDRYKVSQYPTVYQMTSTIEGELLPHTTLIDVLKTLFPCGSISGSPKGESMKLISELEQQPRDVYCGTIGFMTPEKKAIFNVPIRTVVIDRHTEKATYGVGGAITEKSTVDEEFSEIKTKAEILHTKRPTFQLLETFGLFNGKYLVFENHLSRLKKSAEYFNFSIKIDEIKHALLLKAEQQSKGNWRLRLLVSENGMFSIETYPLKQIENEVPVTLAKKPIQKNNPFLYHKTTHREIYETHQQTKGDTFDVLLWNEDKEITEFTIGNIVVELNNELLTPPLSSGLLAGTFREKLLTKGKIKEQKIYLDDLEKCSKIWFINSVRQWVPVKLKK